MAEAYYRQQAGEEAHLPYELKPAAEEAAETHRTADSLEDMLADLPNEEMTLDEIAEKLELPRPLSRGAQNRLSDALKQRGWSKRRASRNKKQVVLWSDDEPAQMGF